MLALLAAPYTESVVATDKNERAMRVHSVQRPPESDWDLPLLVGDLFEPVGQEQFQLVLCNPPFVISPTERYLFSG